MRLPAYPASGTPDGLRLIGAAVTPGPGDKRKLVVRVPFGSFPLYSGAKTERT
jgi:hypothetical protein